MSRYNIGLVLVLFIVSSTAVAAKPDVWAEYMYWDQERTVSSGPFRDRTRPNPSTACSGAYPPYSVKFVNETQNFTETFVCEDVWEMEEAAKSR